ncbi:hypothetical protein QJS10_CPA08g00638 [Acorus calamus]|uniref:BHLH domain-containing protein n=1 Tax=Acorus calamus TaxID=4465 RepID=A0AAV9ECT7_ACOCL|nr:hypothetical protein QJS10_CPA08g00638 [Acorus calamus]
MSEEGLIQTNFLWEAITNIENSVEKNPKKLPPPRSSSNNSPTAVTEIAPPLPPLTGAMGRGSKGSKSESRGGGGEGGELEDHEVHIWTERERRKKMRNMFTSLHSLLPQLPPKADKSTIVDEAVNYIRTLQHTLQKLQKQKLEKLRLVGGGGGGGSSSIATTIDCDQPPPPPTTHLPQPTSVDSREAFMADHGATAASNNNNNWTISTNSPTAVSVPSRLSQCFQTWSSPNVVLNVSGDDAHISICCARKPGLLTMVCYVLEKHNLEVVSANVSSEFFRAMYMIHAHANGVSDQFPEALAVEEVYKLAVGEILLWLSS